MSSGTIDNGRNNVTLRINTPLIGFNGYFFGDKGVILKTPLTVGRLELLKGALNTTDTTMVTVNDPVADTGIVTGKPGESYIVGPLRRMTNSTGSYTFPVGRTGAIYIADYFRQCAVIPSSVSPSMYQAEYVNYKYGDLAVGTPLKGVSATEYWNISKISGADASIMLPLKKTIPGASATDGIVVAHYVNGLWISEHGTVLKPGNSDSGAVVSRSLSAFSPFTFGYGPIPSDTIHHSFTCLKDTTIFADPNTCKAKVSWAPPAAAFADSYNIGNADKLGLKGIFNGHAYYESGESYIWPEGRNIAGSIGAHLVTITSAAENNFITANVIDRNGQGYRWIGLYNTGKAGQFSWVTGEPLFYANWMPGEPNNLYNNNADPAIFEPYVHINGYDHLNRWNDNGNISARFLAEFDSLLVSYRQYSGPANGSVLEPGSYTVCYERTDLQSGKRDSCCFTVKVICNKGIASPTAVNALSTYLQQRTFEALAYPNPTNSGFSLRLNSYGETGKVKMEVTDAVGRIVEVRENIGTKGPLAFGSKYVRGVYFARITQGSKVIILKLVKD